MEYFSEFGILLIMYFQRVYSLEPDDGWHGKNAESRLLEHIKNVSVFYGTAARPVLHHERKITLEYGLRLIQLSVDEPNNILTTSVWVRHIWYAKNVVWNTSAYEGINRIIVPSDWLWTPEIALVNTGDTEEITRSAKCLIKSDGYVFWLVHRVHKSACLFDMTNYPFDQHTCHLWFQSLQTSSGDLDIIPYHKSPMDLDTYLSDFKKSDGWEILSNETIRVPSPRELGELLVFSRRVTLRFSLTLRRRAGFKAYFLTVPCIVLGAMTILVFALPAERPDRTSLATSLLGSFMFLLLILVNTAPPSAASVPKLGVFYAFNICLIVSSLCLSTISVSIMKKGDNRIPMPRWVEKIFLEILAPIFCQHNVSRRIGKPVIVTSENNASHDDTIQNMLPMRSSESHHVTDTKQVTCNISNRGGKDTDNIPMDEHCQAVLDVLNGLNMNLMSIDSAVYKMLKIHERKRQDLCFMIKWKWRIVALVLDRIFMWTYVLIVFVSLFVLLPKPQY